MWSDSSTVIQWIRSSSEKQPTFVANRVAEIFDSSTVDERHHVSGLNNPANLVTRGILFGEVGESDWIKDPDWLKDPIVLNEDNSTPAEQNMEVQVFNAEALPKVIKWSRFSQFNRLRRTVAHILTISRSGANVDTLLSAAENAISKTVQQEEFAPAKASLKRKDGFSNSSKIASLVPFLNDNELIRAKGRLRKSDLDNKT